MCALLFFLEITQVQIQCLYGNLYFPNGNCKGSDQQQQGNSKHNYSKGKFPDVNQEHA